MSLKVQTSNVTNKTDPKSINSRVFIGNLNTAAVNKSDVEGVFSKYGRVLGCSVHKGYAFVQYASERHACGAVMGENGRVLAGQALDVNMAGEPRPTRAMSLKRPVASVYSGYELDYYREELYDRLFDFRGQVSPLPGVLPVKRVTVPVMRRVRTLPVALLTRNSSSNSSRPRGRRTELQAIKSELTQIKANIEDLLDRLEQITKDTRFTDTEAANGKACLSEHSCHDDKASRSDLESSWTQDEDDDDGHRLDDSDSCCTSHEDCSRP
ncbi:RNA-binding protein Raly isoform X2 [Synchiropus splendidus]|nr:RNA-binding protein Raly isoform X2 [Synchiropus splendidus]